MTKPNTTVDCAAYGLCPDCAAGFAASIRHALMQWQSPHFTNTSIVCDDVTHGTMDIFIEGMIGENQTKEFMTRIAASLIKQVGKNK